jgi:hypothetical protein
MLKIISIALFLLSCCLAKINEPRILSSTGPNYNHSFCWKDSYGRGVGTIPGTCPPRYEHLGVLCYTPCPSGYRRAGLDCHQICPSAAAGWADQGLFCRLAEYGRGWGYPWKFGDALNDNGMRSRCEKYNGRGNCEKNGLVYYPKCRRGYRNFGCCICRPAVPNCRALGYNGNFDLSCAKKIQIGNPSSPSCAPNEDNNAGLCYKKCNGGYNGIGPVCWSRAPNGWVDCGMGSAINSVTCGKIIFDQISSVGMMAINIATLGSSGAATTASKSALRNAFKQLQDKTKNARELVGVIANSTKAAAGTYGLAEMLSANPDSVTDADIVRMTAELAAIVDPTGVAGVTAAYSYPKCSALKF